MEIYRGRIAPCFKLSKRAVLTALIFAIISAFAIVTGKCVYENNSVNALFDSKYSFILAVAEYAFIFILLSFINVLIILLYERILDKPAVSAENRFGLDRRRGMIFGIIVFAGLLVIYMTVLLAYYPGIYSYDMIQQTEQALGYSPIDQFQPALHTLLWKLCLNIGNRGGGDLSMIQNAITIYGVIQAVIMAYCISSTVTEIMRSRINWYFALLFSGFLILNPTLWIFSIIPTKDVLFAAFLLLFTKRLYICIKNETEADRGINYILLAIDITLSCLFRNNMIYAMVIVLIYLCIRHRSYPRRLMFGMAAGVLTTIMITHVIYPIAGIQKGSVKESLSLPIMQIAYVYNSEKNDLSEETVKEIDSYISTDYMIPWFNPRFADAIKYLAREEAFENDMGGFIKLYSGLLLQYPEDYINELLALNVSLWYPFSSGIDPVAEQGYISTYILSFYGNQVIRESRLPKAYDFLEKIADYSALEGIPGVRHIFSTAFPFWGIMLFFMLTICDKKREYKLILALPAFLFLCTYLAGPVTLYRYVFPVFLILPILYTSALSTQRS